MKFIFDTMQMTITKKQLKQRGQEVKEIVIQIWYNPGKITSEIVSALAKLPYNSNKGEFAESIRATIEETREEVANNKTKAKKAKPDLSTLDRQHDSFEGKWYQWYASKFDEDRASFSEHLQDNQLNPIDE